MFLRPALCSEDARHYMQVIIPSRIWVRLEGGPLGTKYLLTFKYFSLWRWPGQWRTLTKEGTIDLLATINIKDMLPNSYYDIMDLTKEISVSIKLMSPHMVERILEDNKYIYPYNKNVIPYQRRD